MKGRTILTLGSAALVALACGTTRLNAGSNGDGGTPSADAGPRGLPWLGTPSNSFDQKCDLPAPDWLAGAWQGEFDAYTLPSGSKTIRIEFTGADQTPSAVCGRVTFGQGEPPPVATDPKALPPGANGSLVTPIMEGFAYEFVSSFGSVTSFDAGAPTAPGVDDRRIRFGITLNQIYKSWCNLQLSYAQFDPSTIPGPPLEPLYSCVPRGAFSHGSDGRLCDAAPLTIVGASCAQALYCFLDVCDCNKGSHFSSYFNPV
jgi:hypothetical protein